MADISFKIEGIDEVLASFSELETDLSMAIIQDVIMKSAQIAKDDLARSAPDGDDTKKAKNKLQNNVAVSKNDTGGAYVGFNKRIGFIARFNEYGTKVRSLKGKGKYRRGNRGSMPRRPFVQESYDRSVPVVLEYLQDNFLKLIKKSLTKHKWTAP